MTSCNVGGKISRFFTSKSSHQEKSTENAVKQDNYDLHKDGDVEWEKPIGLTAEAAIDVDVDEVTSSLPVNIHMKKSSIICNSTDAIAKKCKQIENFGTIPYPISGESLVTLPTQETCQGHTRNPFQEFACMIGETESSYFPSTSKTNNAKAEGSYFNNHMQKNTVPKFTAKNDVDTSASKRKRKQKNLSSTTYSEPDRKRKASSRSESDLPFLKMTPEDQVRCKVKWQSFADENAPLEIRRFQVFIAARLHCQAHESTVRAAMKSLRKYFSSPTPSNSEATIISTNNRSEETFPNSVCKDRSVEIKPQTIKCQKDTNNIQRNNHSASPSPMSTMSVEALSKADPNAIAQIISSVLFANVKSKQIVKAAQEINVRFRGVVPETQHSLQQLTGIGPKLGEILYHVNSYRAHRSQAIMEN